MNISAFMKMQIQPVILRRMNRRKERYFELGNVVICGMIAPQCPLETNPNTTPSFQTAC